jgi:hypothetical protein
MRYAGGLDFDPAFAASFGASPRTLEARWGGRGAPWYEWLLVLVHPVSLGILMAVLCLLAFVLVRLRRRRLYRAWAEEESWLGDASREDDEEEPGDVDDLEDYVHYMD